MPVPSRCLAWVAALVLVACTSPQASDPAGASRTIRPTATDAATGLRPTESEGAVVACAAPPCRRRPRPIGRFTTSLAPEASGIAAGARNPRVLYVLDDGPGTTSVLVVSARDGHALGRLHIQGLDSVDTEGLAVGPCAAGGRRDCLYIGDIGDNLEARDTITILRVAEPDLSDGLPAAPVAAERATLRYPDRPHDAEALLVDRDATLVVVTKAPGRHNRGAARLYTGSFAATTLRRGSRLRLPPPALPFAAAVVGNVVTAADATAGRVVVRTYDALYEFTASRPDEPLRRFPTWDLREVPAPSEGQGEAVAYAADGCGLFTVGEGSGRITAIPCR